MTEKEVMEVIKDVGLEDMIGKSFRMASIRSWENTGISFPAVSVREFPSPGH